MKVPSYKKDNLLNKLRKIYKEDSGYGVQGLFDTAFGGSCPCADGIFIVDGKKNRATSRCWRVSESNQDFHFYGDREIGKAIWHCLNKQRWYDRYTLIWETKINYKY